VEFELRLNRRNAIFDRFSKLSQFAALTQGGLLVGYDSQQGVAVRIGSTTNRETTFRSSLIVRGHGENLIRHYLSLEKVHYERNELAYQTFTSGILMCIEKPDTPELLGAAWSLKQWCFRVGHTIEGVDIVCRYTKFLNKLCQAIFLRAELPVREPCFPKEDKLFQVGPLKFISEIAAKGGRIDALSKRQAFILVQMASMTRAGPYPSKEMIKTMVENTLRRVTEPKKIDDQAVKDYRGGLAAIFNRLKLPEVREVHLSLSGSGSNELSGQEGGKGAYMAGLARDLAMQPILVKEIGAVVGLKDCFGEEVLNIDVGRQALMSIINENKVVYWGEVLYVPLLVYLQNDLSNDNAPYGLAKILLLVASQDMKKFGHYKGTEIPNPLEVPLFRSVSYTCFVPDIEAIPVTCAVSIEASGKSRLVSSNPASYTTLGQPVNHFMREWLSKDPFCRIGFEDQEKLWELLNSYKKHFKLATKSEPDF